MSGKGVRWGRDRLGRSEPAFLSANTFALPHLPARREAANIGSCCFCCEAGHLRPLFLRGLCRAGNPLAVSACSALFSRLLFACLPFLPAIPTALISSCPHQVCFAPSIVFCLPPFIPCAPGSPSVRAGGLFSVRASSLFQTPTNQHVCKLRDCPVGSNNAGLQWQPAHRVVFSAPWPVQQDCL